MNPLIFIIRCQSFQNEKYAREFSFLLDPSLQLFNTDLFKLGAFTLTVFIICVSK